MAYKLTWLADVLREADLSVVEEKGWQTRGRRDFASVEGIICHHTAGAIGRSSLGIVRDGRSDLPGPLSQLYLSRVGIYHVVAAGTANHAGRGKWQGVTNGNTRMIGIEAENNGIGEPWSPPIMASYRKGVAAILDHLKLPTLMCCGHREYALPKGRKPDPSFDMNEFRVDVERVRQGALVIINDPTDQTQTDQIKKLRVVGVAPETLNFRATPNGEKRGELNEDTIVDRLDEGPNWTKVKTPGGFVGWVASRYLKQL